LIFPVDLTAANLNLVFNGMSSTLNGLIQTAQGNINLNGQPVEGRTHAVKHQIEVGGGQIDRHEAAINIDIRQADGSFMPVDLTAANLNLVFNGMSSTLNGLIQTAQLPGPGCPAPLHVHASYQAGSSRRYR
jgi:hypothetical protein